MPEGPTIRNTADQLRAALAGQRIVYFHSPLKKAAAEGWAEKIISQQVRAVRSHGKNLFIDFDNGWMLYTHMLTWRAPRSQKQAANALGRTRFCRERARPVE